MIKKYINITEELVELEVEKQLENLPQMFQKYRFYINSVDVVTYALNRLPPLYASSRQGKDYQFEKAQKLAMETIVRQSIIAVLKDPIRKYEPLMVLEPTQLINQFILSQALADLEAFLKEHALISDLEKVTSQNLVIIFQKVLNKNRNSLQLAIKELHELLAEKNLIERSKYLDLDNLVDTIKEVIIQLEKTPSSQDYWSSSNTFELEFYSDFQLGTEEEDEENIPTEPMSDFNRIKKS